MNAKFAIPFVAALVGTGFSTTASADTVLNMLVGTGVGAAVGHSVGGQDGAIVGGMVGAMVGAAASEREHRDVVYERRPTTVVTRTYYAPREVVVYKPRPVYYTERVVYRPVPAWHHRERFAWRDYDDD